MSRQKNTRPTNIYWLYDSRPEMVAAFGPHGKPFYCGKTVTLPEHRLSVHRCDARRYPDSIHSIRITECGEHLTMRIVDVVPIENNWVSYECFWIATIRYLYPGGTNIAKGGQGSAGWIPSADFREKARIARIQRNKSPESRARTSAALTGRIRTPEHCANISAAKIGKKQSAESCAKKSLTSKGKKKPPGFGAKVAARLLGKKRPPEVGAKISASKRGVPRSKPFSPETRAKISAHKTAYWAARRAERTLVA